MSIPASNGSNATGVRHQVDDQRFRRAEVGPDAGEEGVLGSVVFEQHDERGDYGAEGESYMKTSVRHADAGP